MKISENNTYEINEIVFSKLKGFPWWPGQIISIEKNGKKITYHCADPYTQTISKITDNKNIAKFEENIDYIVKNPKGKKHINSITTSIETFFEGKKMPKKYKKYLEDLKKENIGENNPNSPVEKKTSKEIEEKHKKEIKNKNKKGEKKEENNSNENFISIDEDKKEKEVKKINNNGKNKETKKEKNEKEQKSVDDIDEKIDFLLNKKRKYKINL